MLAAMTMGTAGFPRAGTADELPAGHASGPVGDLPALAGRARAGRDRRRRASRTQDRAAIPAGIRRAGPGPQRPRGRQGAILPDGDAGAGRQHAAARAGDRAVAAPSRGAAGADQPRGGSADAEGRLPGGEGTVRPGRQLRDVQAPGARRGTPPARTAARDPHRSASGAGDPDRLRTPGDRAGRRGQSGGVGVLRSALAQPAPLRGVRPDPGPARLHRQLRVDVALLRRQHGVRVAGRPAGRRGQAGPVGSADQPGSGRGGRALRGVRRSVPARRPRRRQGQGRAVPAGGARAVREAHGAGAARIAGRAERARPALVPGSPWPRRARRDRRGPDGGVRARARRAHAVAGPAIRGAGVEAGRRPRGRRISELRQDALLVAARLAGPHRVGALRGAGAAVVRRPGAPDPPVPGRARHARVLGRGGLPSAGAPQDRPRPSGPDHQAGPRLRAGGRGPAGRGAAAARLPECPAGARHAGGHGRACRPAVLRRGVPPRPAALGAAGADAAAPAGGSRPRADRSQPIRGLSELGDDTAASATG